MIKLYAGRVIASIRPVLGGLTYFLIEMPSSEQGQVNSYN